MAFDKGTKKSVNVEYINDVDKRDGGNKFIHRGSATVGKNGTQYDFTHKKKKSNFSSKPKGYVHHKGKK